MAECSAAMMADSSGERLVAPLAVHSAEMMVAWMVDSMVQHSVVPKVVL